MKIAESGRKKAAASAGVATGAVQRRRSEGHGEILASVAATPQTAIAARKATAARRSPAARQSRGEPPARRQDEAGVAEDDDHAEDWFDRLQLHASACSEPEFAMGRERGGAGGGRPSLRESLAGE